MSEASTGVLNARAVTVVLVLRRLLLRKLLRKQASARAWPC